jgi:hypothetical protein
LGDHDGTSEVSLRKTSYSEEPLATSSYTGTPAANAVAPTRSLVLPWTISAWSLSVVVVGGRFEALVAQSRL